MHRKTMLVIVAIGLLAAGCMKKSNSAAPGGFFAVSPQGTPLPTQVENASLPQNTSSQKSGALNVSLALSPYPPASFKQTKFDTTLTDENGLAITDATVTLDLTMPEMPMPANAPAAEYKDKGVYQATGRFTMGGLWRIEVIIQRGSEKQSAYFYIELNQ